MPKPKKTEHGTWTVRYRDPAGKQHRATFDSEDEAIDFNTQNEYSLLTGTWIDPKAAKTPFRTWATRWLDARTGLRPKTLDGYESLLRVHLIPRFGDTPLNRIDHLDIQTFIGELTEQGLSPSRIRQAHQLLNAILKAAVRSRRLAFNPAEGITLPRTTTKPVRFLDSDEVAHLAETVPPRYEAWVYVAGYGGLRWAELAGLKRHRVKLLRRRVQVAETLTEVRGKLSWTGTKTYESRDVALPGFVCDILGRHIGEYVEDDPEALVFTTESGTPLRAPNFHRNIWRPAVAAAGLEPLTPHDLRRTAGSLLIAEGAETRKVMEHLGHSSEDVTSKIYTGVFPDDMDRLADRLEERHRRQTAIR